MVRRKLMIVPIACILAVFFVSAFVLITQSEGAALLSKNSFELIVHLSCVVMPAAAFVALLVEGYYARSWKRNLLANAIAFSIALSLVGLIMSVSGYVPGPENFLVETAKRTLVIFCVGWVYMGIPFCLIMTMFGGYWAKVWDRSV